MSSLNKISYSILTSVKPHLTDDEDLTITKVKYDVGVERSLLIRNELNKGRTLDPAIVQSLGCVDVIKVDESECCDFNSGCYIMRTELQIPNAIETHNKKWITKVGPITLGSATYKIIPYEQVPYTGEGRFNKQDIYAFLFNGYIYLKSKNPDLYLLRKIAVHGVFDDPKEAAKFNHCDGTPCYTDDDNYPMNAWMEKYLTEILFKKYVGEEQLPKDFGNDGKDQNTDRG